MMVERLRLMFAAERRPLLIRHVVFAFALIPIPWFRTGVADLLVVALLFPLPHRIIALNLSVSGRSLLGVSTILQTALSTA